MANRYALVVGNDGRPQQVQSGDGVRTALTILSDDAAGNGRIQLWDGTSSTLRGFKGSGGNITADSPVAASLGFVGPLTGNASTATALATGRTIAITGDLTYTSPTFDGSANVTATGAFPAGRFRGYIDGLITSRASTTTVTVAAGTARDSTDAAFIYLSAATTKTLQSSGAWAAGTGNNGLDTGARANSTWYHVWAISQASGASPDVLFSTSATAPTMPSGYTLKQRIGSIKTDGSGNILAYNQYGDYFYWAVPLADVVVTNPGTSAVTRTLTVPTGIKVGAILTAGTTADVTADMCSGIMITSLDSTDTVGSFQLSSFNIYNAASVINGMIAGIQGPVWTNTSAQVRSRIQISGTNTRLIIDTFGWIDPRGRNG